MPLTKSEPKPSRNRLQFEAIGTHWDISWESGAAGSDLESLILSRIDKFDTCYSRFRKDSLVSAMAAQAGVYDLPEDAQPMFDFYKQLYSLTGGAVSPLVGQTLSDAGYDADYSFQFKATTVAPALEATLSYNQTQLTLHTPALLDFGAVGKGYLVDIISELLISYGITESTINAGGDIRQRTETNKVMKTALQHPENSTLAIGTVSIRNQSICGSSTQLRAWGDYHHVIDPRSGVSPQHLRAVWVVADSTLIADGLTTALFFAPAKLLQKHITFEYAVVHHDGSLEYSLGFPGEFF